MDDQPPRPGTAGTGSLTEAVHQALEYLYATPDLANCHLARMIPGIQAIPDVIRRGQALRNLLMEAIEALRPSRAMPPGTLASRSYQVLSLRYVSGLQIGQISERVALGERQVYRDLRKAEDELALILESHLPDSGPQDVLHQEIQTLASSAQPANLAELLQRALATVRPLAAARRVRLGGHAASQPASVLVAPGILGQVLVQILSATIQALEDNTVTVDLMAEREQATLQIALPCPDLLPREDLLRSALQIAASQGIACQVRQQVGSPCVILLHLPAVQPRPVLVVEDNPGARELYQRYLQGSNWQPTVISDPRAAVETARRLSPVAIILDILMAELDGWSVLQALQFDPQTAGTPVVVCSVIDDRELATTLGAAACLKKPVSRLELLQALERVTHRRSAVSRSAT